MVFKKPAELEKKYLRCCAGKYVKIYTTTHLPTRKSKSRNVYKCAAGNSDKPTAKNSRKLLS